MHEEEEDSSTRLILKLRDRKPPQHTLRRNDRAIDSPRIVRRARRVWRHVFSKSRDACTYGNVLGPRSQKILDAGVSERCIVVEAGKMFPMYSTLAP